MSKNEFDELLLKKLQEEELPYNPAHWDKLARSLPPTLTPASVPGKGRPWLKVTGIAAAVALALSTVLVVQLNRKPATQQEQPVAVEKQPGVHQPKTAPREEDPDSTQPAATNGSATAPNGMRNTIPQPGHTALNKGPVQPGATYPVPDNNYPPPANQPQAHAPQEIASYQPPQPVVPESNNARPEKIADAHPAERSNTAAPRNNSAADIAFLSPFYEGNGNGKKDSKTSISLGGGVNYGNLNTGYTAGISVRRKVAGDFFVDGSVAMMYNNNANNVAANNGPSLGEGKSAARPAAFNQTTLASPALDPIQKLYYVQFNPSLGYQVEKHVALSVGGDFQQMLNKQEEIVQPESNNAKVFPTLDVGLTTKSEFAITPNIQAGLMYREGLNNLLKTDGSRFVNRRYVQVQFKYNIPVN